MSNKEIFFKFVLPLLLTVVGMTIVAFFVVGGFLKFLGEEDQNSDLQKIDRTSAILTPNRKSEVKS